MANHVSNTYYVGKQLLAIGLSIVAFIVTAQVPLDDLVRATEWYALLPAFMLD